VKAEKCEIAPKVSKKKVTLGRGKRKVGKYVQKEKFIFCGE